MRRGLLPDQARQDDPRRPASSAPTASITPFCHRSTEKSLSIGRGKATFHRPSYRPSPPPRPDSRACQIGSVTAPGGGARGTVAEGWAGFDGLAIDGARTGGMLRGPVRLAQMRHIYTSAHFPDSLATAGRRIALRATGGMATITAMTAGWCNLVAVTAADIIAPMAMWGTGSAGARDSCNRDGRRMGRGRFPPTPPLGSIGRIGQAEDRSAGSNSCTD